jgi:competence protein ComEC
MRCAILGFVGGAARLQVQRALPECTTMAACTAIALLLALRGPLRSAPVGALPGFCWAALLAQLALAPQLPKADERNR